MLQSMRNKSRETNLVKGMAAGLLGGLVGSWAMTKFQEVAPADKFARLLGEKEDEGGDEEQQEPAEPTTVKAAEAVSTRVFGRELADFEKQWAGPMVHYSFGSSLGAIFGAAAEVRPDFTLGAGMPFGVVVWLLADEIGVAAMKLSGPPWQHRASTHIYALLSHLVFGLSAEAVRRLVRHRSLRAPTAAQ